VTIRPSGREMKLMGLRSILVLLVLLGASADITPAAAIPPTWNTKGEEPAFANALVERVQSKGGYRSIRPTYRAPRPNYRPRPTYRRPAPSYRRAPAVPRAPKSTQVKRPKAGGNTVRMPATRSPRGVGTKAPRAEKKAGVKSTLGTSSTKGRLGVTSRPVPKTRPSAVRTPVTKKQAKTKQSGGSSGSRPKTDSISSLKSRLLGKKKVSPPKKNIACIARIGRQAASSGQERWDEFNALKSEVEVRQTKGRFAAEIGCKRHAHEKEHKDRQCIKRRDDAEKAGRTHEGEGRKIKHPEGPVE